jgi:cysteine desulfurase family protein (TIGR01976 family)
MFDVDACRVQFPGLAREVNGRPAVFLDGPAGSQVPRRVADAVSRYLLHANANTGGPFPTSRETDELLAAAHRAAAALFGAADPAEVAFGQNMTSLTFALSRALGAGWGPGDDVVVTRLDHDANVTPWVRAARDAGATVRFVGIRSEDCTLRLDELEAALSPRTRLVAVGAASNAVGTVNPVCRIAELAHAAGARVFVDAVHYAPHLLMDVADWGCDFAACSAYKFFWPHVGLLWGRRHLLEELPAYAVRPAAGAVPGRWMTGTQSHEGIAGTLAALDYLAGLGGGGDRRAALGAAYAAIAAYERDLGGRLLRGLRDIRGVRGWGITDQARLAERVPTVAVTLDRLPAPAVADELGRRGLFAWAGHFYAVEVVAALGLAPAGVVRLGLLHYNTAAEVDRVLAELATLAG